MKKFLQKKLKNEKGLTLVELLAVIVILGIIAAIAVPSIGNIIENSRVKAVKADAQTILSAANMYFAENSEKSTVTLTDLNTEKFIDDGGSFPMSGTGTPTVTKSNSTKKAMTISGTGDNKGTKVVFTDATSKEITDSGNSKSVPKSTTP
ncbi:PilD-dependent protein pddA [Lysinibacillus sphaericus]|nr:PilD-dependent protein pddA [Lysinibacillus sphaericus]